MTSLRLMSLLPLALVWTVAAYAQDAPSPTGGFGLASYECENNLDGVGVEGRESALAEIVYQFADGGNNFAQSVASFQAPITDTLPNPTTGGFVEIALPTGTVQEPGCSMNSEVSFRQGYRVGLTFSAVVKARLDYAIDWLVQAPESGPGSVNLQYEFFQDDNSLGAGAFNVTDEGVSRRGAANDPLISITDLGRGLHSIQGELHITNTLTIPVSPLVKPAIRVETKTGAFLPGSFDEPITLTSNFLDGLSFELVSLDPNVEFTPDTLPETPPAPTVDCDTSDEIAAQIDACAENARNHGRFVSCVAKLTNKLKKQGGLSGSEKGRIMSCVAQAEVP